MFTELEKCEVFAHDGDGHIGFAHYDENKDWHDLVPLQYTGLKDKNGAEIYEGDIVETDDANIKGAYIFQSGTFIIDGTQTINTTGTEVIGNIHENPELL